VSDLVFDNTCLSHFARARRLELLEAITAGYDRATTVEVMDEILGGVADHPELGDLVGIPWLSIIELELHETVRAAVFKAELGGSPDRDLGECTVLAVTEARDGTAVIDDQDAVATGRRHCVTVVGTIAIIAKALKRDLLQRTAAEQLIDELAATDMRLPCDGAGLFAWCYTNELLP
jgi:predicted nucleic acid-binding protein